MLNVNAQNPSALRQLDRGIWFDWIFVDHVHTPPRNLIHRVLQLRVEIDPRSSLVVVCATSHLCNTVSHREESDGLVAGVFPPIFVSVGSTIYPFQSPGKYGMLCLDSTERSFPNVGMHQTGRRALSHFYFWRFSRCIRLNASTSLSRTRHWRPTFQAGISP